MSSKIKCAPDMVLGRFAFLNLRYIHDLGINLYSNTDLKLRHASLLLRKLKVSHADVFQSNLDTFFVEW